MTHKVSARYVTESSTQQTKFVSMHRALHQNCKELFAITRKKAATRLRSLRRRLTAKITQTQEQKYLQKIALLAHETEALFDKTVRHAEHECLSLTLAILQEILCTQVTIDQKSLADRIQLQLQTLRKSCNCLIEVSASDYENLKKLLHHQNIQLRITAHMSPGNARIITESGTITLDWMNHLRTIAGTLIDSLNNKTIRSSHEFSL